MTEIEFEKLVSEGYNKIPFISETFADLETPLSLYLKLTQNNNNSKNTFLLESVLGGERFGRYSFIGLPAKTVIQAFGKEIQILKNDKIIKSVKQNPLDFLEKYVSRFKIAPNINLPRFCGGLAGYFGYDTVRYIEKKLENTSPPDDLKLPDIQLFVTDELAVIDNLLSKLYFIVFADTSNENAYKKAKDRLQYLKKLVRTSNQNFYSPKSIITNYTRDFNKTDYLKTVAKVKEYIKDGDLMQVQIGQRIRKPFNDSPLSLYRALRSLNPSPYMYYYNFGDTQIIGSSPEILVRNELNEEGEKKITIRPLAGTRPRGKTTYEDNLLSEELLSNHKEIAEHVMLIDLARNDIGRIAKIGSVKVTEKFSIEKYSHVQHIVSNVEGILKTNLSNIDVLKATFPAGTLSGAPKVRAMEIIDELEPTKRGIYGGACGYISFKGEMDLAIAIRTGVIKEKMLYVQAAAGIVADSIPEMEWLETENKVLAVLRAAQHVQEGLDNEV